MRLARKNVAKGRVDGPGTCFCATSSAAAGYGGYGDYGGWLPGQSRHPPPPLARELEPAQPQLPRIFLFSFRSTPVPEMRFFNHLSPNTISLPRIRSHPFSLRMRSQFPVTPERAVGGANQGRIVQCTPAIALSLKTADLAFFVAYFQLRRSGNPVSLGSSRKLAKFGAKNGRWILPLNFEPRCSLLHLGKKQVQLGTLVRELLCFLY